MGSKPGKAAKAGYLRANTYSMSVDTYSMSIDQTPTETEPVHTPDPNPMKDCRPCSTGKTAGCPDIAGYCETTATFYPTRIDDPITLTCEVCTDEGCPTIAIANCTDFLRSDLAAEYTLYKSVQLRKMKERRFRRHVSVAGQVAECSNHFSVKHVVEAVHLYLHTTEYVVMYCSLCCWSVWCWPVPKYLGCAIGWRRGQKVREKASHRAGQGDNPAVVRWRIAPKSEKASHTPPHHPPEPPNSKLITLIDTILIALS
eukprot:scaffold13573_cov99-Skeletonema_dohrnii-CCMP3373.AAC.2